MLAKEYNTTSTHVDIRDCVLGAPVMHSMHGLQGL